MNIAAKLFRIIAVASGLMLPSSLLTAQTPSAASTAPKASKTTQATTAPTAQEIADAKAKGMVWVNTNTKVYHKDGQYYGTTKHGKFMTEDDATKAGYRAAKMPGGTKKSATPPAPGR